MESNMLVSGVVVAVIVVAVAAWCVFGWMWYKPDLLEDWYESERGEE